jgi:hypothetical protein
MSHGGDLSRKNILKIPWRMKRPTLAIPDGRAFI